MQYTNDVIFTVKYKDENESLTFSKKSLIKKCIYKIKADNYFKLTMLVSFLFLCMDYFLIKEFIELVNLL